MTRIYTVGHSTRVLEEFLGLLQEFEIRLLADVRSFPSSRKYPWFTQEPLKQALKGKGIEYRWFRGLGGLRRGQLADSPHAGLRSPGFRNYADHMATVEFQQAVAELIQAAEDSLTAYMCAEALYWRCHRMLLSDYLAVHGLQVVHILGPGQTRPHSLTKGLQVEASRLIYGASTPPLFR